MCHFWIIKWVEKKTWSHLRSIYLLSKVNKSLTYHADNSIPCSQDPVIPRMNSVSNLVPYFLNVHLNIIIQCKPNNSSHFLSSSFPIVVLFSTRASSDPPSSQGISGGGGGGGREYRKQARYVKPKLLKTISFIAVEKTDVPPEHTHYILLDALIFFRSVAWIRLSLSFFLITPCQKLQTYR